MKTRTLIESFKCAFKGIGCLFCRERNARVHALFTVLVLGLGVWLGLGVLEWSLVTLAAVMVWVAEAFNSVLEFLTDVLSPDDHKWAAQAKDMGAAAVLIAVIGALIVGLCVLGPPLLTCFQLT